jgi:hypothetical protein
VPLWLFVGIFALFALQIGLIAGLLVNRARRRAAEDQSERRYRLATSAGLVGVWDWNLESNENAARAISRIH